METPIPAILEDAVRELRRDSDLNIDRVVDHLVRLAADHGKVEASCADQLEVVLGKGVRFYFDLGDGVGRFRHLLARLYVRCSEGDPHQVEGTIYGFEGRLNLPCESLGSTNVRIKTENVAGFPRLLIEAFGL